MTKDKVEMDWDKIKKSVFEMIEEESKTKAILTIEDVVNITSKIVDAQLKGTDK